MTGTPTSEGVISPSSVLRALEAGAGALHIASGEGALLSLSRSRLHYDNLVPLLGSVREVRDRSRPIHREADAIHRHGVTHITTGFSQASREVADNRRMRGDDDIKERTLSMSRDGVVIARSDLEKGAAVRFALEHATMEEVAEATGLTLAMVEWLSKPPRLQGPKPDEPTSR